MKFLISSILVSFVILQIALCLSLGKVCFTFGESLCVWGGEGLNVASLSLQTHTCMAGLD